MRPRWPQGIRATWYPLAMVIGLLLLLGRGLPVRLRAGAEGQREAEDDQRSHWMP